MKIRPATNADIPMLCKVAEKTWRTCYLGIISHEQIEFMLGWMYSPERLREEMERGVMWEVVENEEQRPVGFLSHELQPDGRVKLHKLYVLPEEQGKGLGRVALAHAMEQARRIGASEVWLQVNKKNQQAIAAYEKAGFRIAEEAVFDIGMGFVMDDFLMSKAV